MHTVGDLVLKSAQWLQAKGVDSPRLDAELLLARVLDCDRLRLYMEWTKPLMELEVAAYRELIRRRGAERIPVARLLERREFYGRPFHVGPESFVPRPETEGLVERALDLLDSDPALQTPRPVVFEVGTGTGAISISIGLERPGPQIIATDISEGALEIARRNARDLQAASRVDFRAGGLLAGYDGTIHLLVSNPPYIPSGQIPGLPPEVRDHDPRTALDGGEDGLDVVRGILEASRKHLVPGGGILLEIGEDQEGPVLGLFAREDWIAEGRIERDYGGRPRYAVAKRRVDR